MDYIFVGIFGMLIGSFLNMCADRIPRGESIVRPRSHCRQCGTVLSPVCLVPVFSFVFLKGRCRYCGAKLSIKEPLAELFSGALFAFSYYWFGLTFELLAALTLLTLLILAVLTDIDFGIIPDRVPIIGIVLGLIYAGFGLTAHSLVWIKLPILDALAGIVCAGLPLLLMAVAGDKLFKKDSMGGGDIKLMAMAGAFLGARLGLLAVFVSVVSGGIFASVKLLCKPADREMPFGPWLALGSYLSLILGDTVLEWYSSLIRY